ncbi:hypothetical protein [Candidatus Protochlamydia phocaeensis]|uniref:hypothetical protein n=1 Tax=Candidatus Protochlamydia phocaeensis TaxID=1414722 RepID=UPI00083834A1|nr:hypothetical protein [Candidatus Protochlamydia phocaeensis]
MGRKNALPSIWNRQQIESAIDLPYCLQKIEEGLIAAAQGNVLSPPMGFLHFNQPSGDVHIKYGYLEGQNYYVVKIASGFYGNPGLGLPSSQGVMMLFKKQTGELESILLDEGLLTDIRTGLAGAICAKYLAPPVVDCIGIIGTGTQALHQLHALRTVISCRQVKVWGRDASKARLFAQHPLLHFFDIEPVSALEEITKSCHLIVTTTPSTSPLLFDHQLMPGTHITAVGSDAEGKQELDASVLLQADLVAADNLEQCRKYGELAYVPHLNSLRRLVELGQGLAHPHLLKREPHWSTVADLTGVAVEDIQIASAVFEKLKGWHVQ